MVLSALMRTVGRWLDYPERVRVQRTVRVAVVGWHVHHYREPCRVGGADIRRAIVAVGGGRGLAADHARRCGRTRYPGQRPAGPGAAVLVGYEVSFAVNQVAS